MVGWHFGLISLCGQTDFHSAWPDKIAAFFSFM
jgi:hypothetical protein